MASSTAKGLANDVLGSNDMGGRKRGIFGILLIVLVTGAVISQWTVSRLRKDDLVGVIATDAIILVAVVVGVWLGYRRITKE